MLVLITEVVESFFSLLMAIGVVIFTFGVLYYVVKWFMFTLYRIRKKQEDREIRAPIELIIIALIIIAFLWAILKLSSISSPENPQNSLAEDNPESQSQDLTLP